VRARQQLLAGRCGLLGPAAMVVAALGRDAVGLHAVGVHDRARLGRRLGEVAQRRSTRRVDQLVESLGLRISRSEVSRICAGLDEQVEAFRTRPLEGRYVYLFLDAKVEKVRDGGRVVCKAMVIAYGVHETGRREIIALDVGAAETEPFWREFLRSLVARGLIGVQLVVSDAHEGLKAAIAKVLGCPWQRCTVQFLRDCLGHARRDQQPMLAALIRPIFGADDLAGARDQLSAAVAALEGKLGKAAALLEDAEPDILAFYSFPPEHWRKLRSTDESVKGRTPHLFVVFGRPFGRVGACEGGRSAPVGSFPAWGCRDRPVSRIGGPSPRCGGIEGPACRGR
jgi:mutator family transposase